MRANHPRRDDRGEARNECLETDRARTAGRTEAGGGVPTARESRRTDLRRGAFRRREPAQNAETAVRDNDPGQRSETEN
jgi:hypothetical protein